MINHTRSPFILPGALALAVVMLAGCGQQESAPATTAEPVAEAPATETEVTAATSSATETVSETVAAATDQLGRLVQAFEQTDAATLANVQKAVGAVRGGNYADALPLLQQVAGQANLTAEQTKLLQDVIDMATQKLAEAGAAKSVTDLQKSLPLGK